MARHGLTRPVGALRIEEPPRHDRWYKDRLTGSLQLTLETPQGQFVSPSTGRLTLTEEGGQEVVAQEAARTTGTPVLPGTGIKGAVRNLYELLSFSCDPFARKNFKSRQTDPARCTAYRCCDACSVFGMLGRNGRAGFDDARPAMLKSVVVEVRKVPVPWPPRKPQGHVSLYDFQEAQRFDRDRKVFVTRDKEISREVFLGTFETRLTFWNLTQEELGRLLLSMGIGVDESTRFFLRLGGVKYDGQGAVVVRPQALTLASPGRKRLEAGDGQREIAKWLEAARTSAWAGIFWPKLEEAARLLRKAG